MTINEDILEKRYNRLEDAIERLVDVSSNLNKMLAVHEERIKNQEKQILSMEDTLEKRREESEVKLKDVYETIRAEDKNIISEIATFREETKKQYADLSRKMSWMEKVMYLYMGGMAVIIFVVENYSFLTTILTKVK